MFSGYTDEYKGKNLYKYYSYNDCMENMFAAWKGIIKVQY